VYYNDISTIIVNMLFTLSETIYTVTAGKAFDPKYVDKQMIVIYQLYIKYLEGVASTLLFKKTGAFRKHVLGTRSHFTARGVIIPITEPHDFDEHYLPWTIGVELYELEILAKLHNDGYNFIRAQEIMRKARVRYVERIDNIFKVLIKESPFKGLPNLIGRNPSLRPGAIQLEYCSRIKVNWFDKTIAVPGSTLSACNADFDGDCKWIASIKEVGMAKAFKNFSPAAVTIGFGRPEVDDSIRMTKPETVTFNNWLNE
jgi:hypothetical protein